MPAALARGVDGRSRTSQAQQARPGPDGLTISHGLLPYGAGGADTCRRLGQEDGRRLGEADASVPPQSLDDRFHALSDETSRTSRLIGQSTLACITGFDQGIMQRSRRTHVKGALDDAGTSRLHRQAAERQGGRWPGDVAQSARRRACKCLRNKGRRGGRGARASTSTPPFDDGATTARSRAASAGRADRADRAASTA